MWPPILVEHQLNHEGQSAGIEADEDQIVHANGDQGKGGEKLEPGVLG